MPELIEQDLHPNFSTLHSAEQITKAKAMEFIFTPKIFYSTTLFPSQKIIETQEPRLYTLMDLKWTKALVEHIAYRKLASWQGKLNHNNSIFQAEILAIKMTIEAASSLQRPIKIWTDSLSSLMAILNL
ncbi:hypothetical protein AVEN_114761-1 [Araneus ventricosus]|uniref:RNase H type-1 domain-containing protein n=1 Tax=Araneus ventricosus TaxID=182803 RepID=A0A4Y2NC60_ARAVE|nr:hypothetical protein AVEN_114761-1 [Araneus ventricosus]